MYAITAFASPIDTLAISIWTYWTCATRIGSPLRYSQLTLLTGCNPWTSRFSGPYQQPMSTDLFSRLQRREASLGYPNASFGSCSGAHWKFFSHSREHRHWLETDGSQAFRSASRPVSGFDISPSSIASVRRISRLSLFPISVTCGCGVIVEMSIRSSKILTTCLGFKRDMPGATPLLHSPRSHNPAALTMSLSVSLLARNLANVAVCLARRPVCPQQKQLSGKGIGTTSIRRRGCHDASVWNVLNTGS